MKGFAALLILLTSIVCLADAAPSIRGIAPNSAAPGETLIIRVVIEGIESPASEEEISLGEGIQLQSIVQQSFQRRRERRLLFLQAEVRIEDSAIPGPRKVRIAGSTPNQAALFYVYSSPSEFNYEMFRQFPTLLIPARLLRGNLDPDATDELVSLFMSPLSDGWLEIIDPAEKTRQTLYSVTSEGQMVSPREAVLTDKNLDGFPDLAILNWVQFDVLGGVLTRARNRGDGTYQMESDRQSRIGDLFIANGDFDADRSDDLALVGFTGEVVVIPGGGKPSFRFKTLPTPFMGELQNMVAGDVNRDGLDDLVLAIDNEASGKKELGIVLAKNDGTFQAVKRYSLPFPQDNSWNLAVSDLNNDDLADIVFTTDEYRQLVIATYSRGRLSFRPTIGVECNSMAIGDLDANGFQDIACAGGDIDQIALIRSGKGTSLLPRITLPGPRFPASVAIGDWNGDRSQDLAIGFGKLYFPADSRKGIVFLTRTRR